MTETSLYKPILDYLARMGVPAVRKQSGTVCIGGRWVHMGEEGWPDIIGILPPTGRFLGIEVKLPGKQLAKKQIERAVQLTDAGAVVLIASSVEDIDHTIRLLLGRDKGCASSK